MSSHLTSSQLMENTDIDPALVGQLAATLVDSAGTSRHKDGYKSHFGDTPRSSVIQRIVQLFVTRLNYLYSYLIIYALVVHPLTGEAMRGHPDPCAVDITLLNPRLKLPGALEAELEMEGVVYLHQWSCTLSEWKSLLEQVEKKPGVARSFIHGLRLWVEHITDIAKTLGYGPKQLYHLHYVGETIQVLKDRRKMAWSAAQSTFTTRAKDWDIPLYQAMVCFGKPITCVLVDNCNKQNEYDGKIMELLCCLLWHVDFWKGTGLNSSSGGLGVVPSWQSVMCHSPMHTMTLSAIKNALLIRDGVATSTSASSSSSSGPVIPPHVRLSHVDAGIRIAEKHDVKNALEMTPQQIWSKVHTKSGSKSANTRLKNDGADMSMPDSIAQMENGEWPVPRKDLICSKCKVCPADDESTNYIKQHIGGLLIAPHHYRHGSGKCTGKLIPNPVGPYGSVPFILCNSRKATQLRKAAQAANDSEMK